MSKALNDRLKILKYLREEGPLTTIFARETLGIMHPGGRVQELRKQGYNILTYECVESDASKTQHRVAKYVLMNKRESAND